MYADFLRRHVPRVNIDVLFVADPDAPLPAGVALESYDAYIWTGSDLTIYHDDPRVTRQIELARAIYRVGRPMYGSCWGVQMASVAAGGEVQKNPKGREWGIARDIRLTEAGKTSLLYTGKPERFDGFIMHLDEVTRIPSGGKLLATNEHTYVQALEVTHEKGTFWATQYHPEYNLYEMGRLIAARAGALVKEGFFPDSQAVAAYADQMRILYEQPDSAELRRALSVGPDILDAGIRECELRNWIDLLVLPSLSDR
jgi:GMP synthase (glutamine-hydrolysing)